MKSVIPYLAFWQASSGKLLILHNRSSKSMLSLRCFRHRRVLDWQVNTICQTWWTVLPCSAFELQSAMILPQSCPQLLLAVTSLIVLTIVRFGGSVLMKAAILPCMPMTGIVHRKSTNMGLPMPGRLLRLQRQRLLPVIYLVVVAMAPAGPQSLLVATSVADWLKVEILQMFLPP
mmetsp:Transcript_108792/g.188890  ORF Transcript_108792/g.188890 Transcript_108792/m.188890 type:complete len:175 (+) Transcript_108792:342-866(+)